LPWDKRKQKSNARNINAVPEKQEIGDLEGSRIINIGQLQQFTQKYY